MRRRDFVVGAGSTVLAVGAGRALAQEKSGGDAVSGAEPFSVLFAPGPRHFGGAKNVDEYLDAIKRAYDFGFRAWEDNRLIERQADLQTKVGALLKEKGMTMGVSVVSTGDGLSFSEANQEGQDRVIGEYQKAVECAKRVGHKWFTLVPGSRVEGKGLSEQIKGSSDLMQRCCDIFEEAGLVAVVEPLSHKMSKKPVLLETFQDGYEFCKVVNRPSCKLLADYYHQQQVGGNLIKATDECWDQIAYVQYGDVPGRKQPGTGEINYVTVTKHLKDKGFTGLIGLEHGIKGKTEDLVASYREIDRAIQQ